MEKKQEQSYAQTTNLIHRSLFTEPIIPHAYLPRIASSHY